MLHGWLILDKPLGLGSTQAVGAVKRALRTGGYPKVKVGHGGTLDPLATGVLPIALGEATKLAGRMLDSDKVYEFTIGFGVETDTLDLEGREVATSPVRPTVAELAAALPRFTGPIAQMPPAYSALKIDGRRAYDLARDGAEVVLAERQVTIHALTLLGGDAASPRFRAHVSKGTYIRSLARDIARAVGTVGHVTALRRVKAGPFDLSHAIALDKLDELGQGRALESALVPLEAALDGIPALALTPAEATYLKQGRVLERETAQEGLHLACLGALPIALVEAQSGLVRVERGFNIDAAKEEF